MDTLENLKRNHNIFTIAPLAGVELKKASNNLFYSPFRDDNKASFSIYDNGRKFKDFATDQTGDCINFYALAKNIDNKQAIKELTGNNNNYPLKAKNKPSQIALESPSIEKPLPCIPPLIWDNKYIKMLRNAKGFNLEALKFAYDAGVFGFCEYRGFYSWIITDKAKKAAQARRLDGLPFFNNAKAITLKNSDASYPIGLSEIANKKLVCLCEGSTDFLALFHFAYIYELEELIAPICMLGATQNINAQYLNAFTNRNILIFSDQDQAGKKALNSWGNSLSEVAESVKYFDYADAITDTGKAVKDLCDFMQLDYNYWEEIRPYDNPFFETLNNLN